MNASPLPQTATRRTRRPALRPVALAACLLAGSAGAADILPRGMQVAAGQATLTTNGSQLTITNSRNAILNWQSFSIGQGNTVRFDQPSASSQVLNRVLGRDPSAINGQISSNGRVWLLNPYGVLFGAQARVDVAGLVTSTLSLSDADWQAQRYSLTANTLFPGATIVNQGELRTTGGGHIVLVGSNGGVRNEGSIDAGGGRVVLAAGSSVDLVDTALPNLAVRVNVPAGEVLNLGAITSAGGRIDLHAAVVNQQGIVRANGIGSGRGGEVVLTGSDSVTLAAASQTTADGASGGRVVVDAGAGTTLIGGLVSALGTQGGGGSATLLGRQVGLLGGATVDVSGRSGGGDVWVGGGVQGRDASLRNADAVYFDGGARIAADATERGDGGRIVLWSDHATRAFGALSARGGALGGDGGFIETSGGWLDARPASVRTDAAAGRSGHWLLDPSDVIITDNVEDSGISGSPNFTPSSDTAVLSTASIVAALNANNNVTVTTSSSEGEANGDIKVTSANIKPTPTAAVSLTLNADRNIVLDFTTVRSDGAPLSVNLNAGTSGNGGAVAVRSSSIITRGGDIVIGGASFPCGPNQCENIGSGAVGSDQTGLRDGILVASSTLDAGSGSIKMTGHSVAQNADASGVAIVEGSTLNARTIDITGTIDSDGPYFRTGVKLAGGTITATERISIDGAAYSGVYQDDAYPVGVDVLSELRVDPGEFDSEALLSVTGTVQEAQRFSSFGLPAVQRFAVGIRGGAGKLVAANGAALQVSGSDLSPNGDFGIYAVGSAENFIDASSASQLTLTAAFGGIRIGGQVLAPEGGPLTITADGLLSIEAATITGNASRVTLAGQTVEIGTLGEATQLSFGDETPVQISAESFRFGFLPSIDVGEGGGIDTGGLSAGRSSQGMARRLDLSPPEATALIATGGVISVFANSVEFGPGAVLHSEAGGNAILMAGLGESSNIGSFANGAGSGVLSTPNGHWLIYAVDPDSVDTPFDAGALQADFRQYGAAFGTEPAASGNGFLFSTSALLSLSGSGTPSKVYDGNTNVDLDSIESSVTGLKSGDHLVVGVRYDDKNVGTGKAIVVAPSGATGIVDANGAPVYGYTLDSERMLGDVTPRTLELASVVVADKRYDGTTQAFVSSWNFNGLVAGDQVRVGTSTATFSDANVGTAKPVSASYSSLTGTDARNYVIGESSSATGSASITAAFLSYVADPVNIVRGGTLPALTGSVTGFVGEETLSSATTGTLAFGTTTLPDAEPGHYAINGSGLSAANYVFVQASANAVALTIAAPPAPPPVPVEPTVNAAMVSALTLVSLPTAPSSPQSGRSLDALQAVQSGAPGDRTAFASLDLGKMSQDAIASVLAAREEYKRSIFSQALSRLEDNPGLADAAGCATAEQAASGVCLMTAPLGNALAISNARVVEQGAVAAPQPGTPAAATPAPAPAQTPAAAVAAAPAAAPGPAPAPGMTPDAALAALPEATLRLPAARAVKSASVPQIVRKIAVLIGIDQYNDARIPTLANAVADARAVAQSLETNLGYQTVVLENPTRTTIFRTLNQLSTALGPNDSVVLYYAGHGDVVEKTGLGYWQPADADPARPETWISNTDIGRLLRQLPAQQVAMISDSCFSGSLVSDERIRGISAQDPAALLNRRATVVMSSGGNEPVFDSGKDGHSPFAYSLLQSLSKVSTWKPGSSLFEQVRFDVARQLPQRPQYGASRVGGHETGTDYLFEQRQLEGVTR